MSCYTGAAKYFLDNAHQALADFVAADKEDEFSYMDEWAFKEGLVEHPESSQSAKRNFDEDYSDHGVLRAWRASSGYQEFLNRFCFLRGECHSLQASAASA